MSFLCGVRVGKLASRVGYIRVPSASCGAVGPLLCPAQDHGGCPHWGRATVDKTLVPTRFADVAYISQFWEPFQYSILPLEL